MPIKSVKMKISKKKKIIIILMSQGSLNPKIRFLGQKVWPVDRGRMDRQTDRHESTIQTTPFQGFRIFSFNLSSRIGPIHKIQWRWDFWWLGKMWTDRQLPLEVILLFSSQLTSGYLPENNYLRSKRLTDDSQKLIIFFVSSPRCDLHSAKTYRLKYR